MKLIAVALLAGCVDSGKDERIAEIEARIAKLENRPPTPVQPDSDSDLRASVEEVRSVLRKGQLALYGPPPASGIPPGWRNPLVPRANWWCTGDGPCSRTQKDCEQLRASASPPGRPCDERRMAFCGTNRLALCVGTLERCESVNDAAIKASPEYGSRCVGVE